MRTRQDARSRLDAEQRRRERFRRASGKERLRLEPISFVPPAEYEVRYMSRPPSRDFHDSLSGDPGTIQNGTGSPTARQVSVDSVRQFGQSRKDNPLYATKNL